MVLGSGAGDGGLGGGGGGVVGVGCSYGLEAATVWDVGAVNGWSGEVLVSL